MDSSGKIAVDGLTGCTLQEPSLGQGCVALTGMLTLPLLFERGTSVGEAVAVYIGPKFGPHFLEVPFLDT